MILYDKQYFNYFEYRQSMQDQNEYPPLFPYLKHLEAIDPSFETIIKLSSNEIREKTCERLK